MASSDGLEGASSSTPPLRSTAQIDPVLRNTLRYTISAKEYQTLHRYLITRSPPAVRKRAPPPAKYKASLQSKDDFNAAALRASLRVFVAAQTGLTLWDVITLKILRRGKPSRDKPKSFFSSPNFRLSLSLSLILLVHRLLYRYLTRLRTNLLKEDAAPFRQRNPHVSKALTARLAPAIGASLAGFALGVCPADQLRITITIYTVTRAAEFAYNAFEDEGWFKNKPWWWGSWMLMPVASGQLLHAFVLDRDCFPAAYGNFILKYTPNYIQRRPSSYPAHLPWPTSDQIVDSLAEMSKQNWPPFTSPILHPSTPSPLSAIAPITSPAHPSIPFLSCATLHPSTPSCLQTYLTYHLTAFPPLFKFLLALHTLFSLPSYRTFLSPPSTILSSLLTRTLRTTTFLSSAIGTSWASICLFQTLLPRSFLPTQRWFLGGFLGGLWAFVDRKNGRASFLYSFRASVDSTWKLGRKRSWWRGVSGGDVWLFVAGLMVWNALFERGSRRRKRVLRDRWVRRGLSGLRGEGWGDGDGDVEEKPGAERAVERR